MLDALLERQRLRWAGYWPGADVEAIAADVRARYGAAVAAWGLREVRVLGGGEVALVCAAGRAGQPVILKVNPRGHSDDAQLATEGAALSFWQPGGAVPRLIDSRDDGFTILMEELRPGSTLDAAGLPWDDRLAILARLAAGLHGAGTAPPGFVHLGEYALSWRRALAGEPDLLAELEELVEPWETDVLIHADLHGGNALRHGDAWKVIDPHAVRGDRHADVWALLDPLVPALPRDPAAAARTARRWVARYAAAAGMDPLRAAAWARLRARAVALTIDACVEPPGEDAAWVARLHRMADALG
jgi:streptomycin 6-kinase